MDAKLHKPTIELLSKSGVYFVVDLRWVGGSRSITIEARDLEKYVSDPVGFTAQHFGASVEDYLRWIETEGTPQCGALTKKGKRCTLSVAGGGQRDFKRWKELDGGYCQVHGGETSAEANEKRRSH
ncbi:hypothetical protein JET14_11870 [Martelella lutilitoris]|uniref:Uncharacterized protein n=1 Tax=Martelella lutilitoris TaxID=2583532 RepID=A0A7T7HH63_9HYPH|nr:hypothetical protein [Martelella lutilitoris]QQM29038.1 hypothetical protein JET14_11870 [Martelella lutilitoris]